MGKRLHIDLSDGGYEVRIPVTGSRFVARCPACGWTLLEIHDCSHFSGTLQALCDGCDRQIRISRRWQEPFTLRVVSG